MRDALSIFSIAFTLSGCGSLSYLIQAGTGQMALIQHARPISEVLKDERTSPRIRKLLSQIPEIKKYGESNGLKPTSNYVDYVKLDRTAAVWVVSACDALEFKSKEWNFPVVGSFPYLGWFNLESAKKYAEEVKQEGWDVDLRGAGAYSTLGWFRDSVLSTMIPEGDEALGDLVNVVLHESVHASLYIKGQSYFNESLASFVADELTPVYLEKLTGKSSPELLSYLTGEERSQRIHKRMHEVYGDLSRLYASSASAQDKFKQKNSILLKVKEELQFKREINNATIIQFKTYDTGKEDFKRLLNQCDSKWVRFMDVLKKLDSHSFSKGQQEDLHLLLTPLYCA